MRHPRTSAPSIRPPGSQLLHIIDDNLSRPLVAWILLLADGAWVTFSVFVGFPTRLETIFQTLVAAATLALVFVIQHTQAREQLITQRKLDELLRALPRARNDLIALELASDDEVEAIHSSHLERRRESVGTGASGETPAEER